MALLRKVCAVLLLCGGVNAWYSFHRNKKDSTLRYPGETYGPWPPGKDKKQAVRFCYADDRSMERLEPIVKEAIDRWAPALFPNSGLYIELYDPEKPVCDSTKKDIDPLIIIDETQDEKTADDKAHNDNCGTSTSTYGYNYEDTGKLDRHKMKFCGLRPGKEKDSHAWAVQEMMHELSHVVGFAHEHQRPDVREYLDFECSRMTGYDEEHLRKVVMEDEDGKYEAAGVEENVDLRMKLLCTTFSTAKAYFPPVLEWLPGDEFPSGEYDVDDKGWGKFQKSAKFDYDSITIYDSTLYAKNKESSDGWVQWRKDTKKEVFMGGSNEPEKAKLSDLDIARVKQLYVLPEKPKEPADPKEPVDPKEGSSRRRRSGKL